MAQSIAVCRAYGVVSAYTTPLELLSAYAWNPVQLNIRVYVS